MRRGDEPPSGGPLLRLLDLLPALQAMQIIDRALRVAGGGDDEALVTLQDREPGGDIGGVVRPDFWRDTEIAGEESGPEFGDEFFAGIAFVAMGHPPEVPGQAAVVLGPVHAFMGNVAA